MKKTSIFLFFVLICLPLFAAPIGKERAAEYAREFYKAQNGNTKSDINPRQIYPSESTTKGAAQSPVYMFAFDNAKGFVVLSGDDRLTPVLGYSLNSDISIENMPPQMYSWIKWYEYQINQVLSDNVEPNTSISVKNLSEIKATEVVAPLLGSISYNQGAPYNRFTPHPQPETYNYRTHTGCVATAITQILRYNKYPARGIGNVNYTTRTLKLSLSTDLSASTYNYDKMLPSYKYGTSYTTEQAEAVATLMRDVGYAVNMDYGYDASGAYDIEAGKGMIDHFGYSLSARYLQRNYIEDKQWIDMIKAELDASRPFYYSGNGGEFSSSGHAFVCDGYNDAGYFHFNWGWDGFGDGWYVVDQLKPVDLGTGSGSGDYSYNQSMLWGMRPAKEEDEVYYQMLYSGDTCGLRMTEGSYSREDTDILVKASDFWNYSLGTLEGKLGFVIFKGKEYVKSLYAFDVKLDIWYGYNYREQIVGEGINDLPNGKYRIMLASSVGSSNTWQKVLAPVGGVDEYAIELTDTKCIISLPVDEEPELPLISDLIISEYVEGKGYNKAIELYNRSGKELDLSKYSLKRQDKGDGVYAKEIILSGILPDSGVYILVHDSAESTLKLKADIKLPNSGFMTFNGDDVIGLFKQGELIDVIGSTSPVEWGKDTVMIRNCGITSPSANYDEYEWKKYSYDYFTDLGYYCGIEGKRIKPSDTVVPPEPEIVLCSSIRELKTKAADGKTVYKLTNIPEITAIGGGVRNQMYIQDATAAILIDDPKDIITGSYKVGDKIKGLTGSLSISSGTYQFVPIEDATKEAGTVSVTHREISLADLQNKSKMDELQSQLIKINKVFFVDSGIFANGAQYKLTDGSITDELFKVHIHNVDYVGKPIPNKLDTVNLVGLVVFDGSKYYISPRFYNDFTILKHVGNEENRKYAPMCEVYPNPVSDVLNIIAINANEYSSIGYNSTGYNSSAGYKVEILNISSSKVKEYYWKELNGSIDVSDLVPGMYFLKISSLNQNMLNVFKIVKK